MNLSRSFSRGATLRDGVLYYLLGYDLGLGCFDRLPINVDQNGLLKILHQVVA